VSVVHALAASGTGDRFCRDILARRMCWSRGAYRVQAGQGARRPALMPDVPSLYQVVLDAVDFVRWSFRF
jgi:hypothetical protein